jgi:CHAD domain-containing protein
VTRALGTVRELDVTLNVLKAEAARHGWPATSVSELTRHVEAERERRRRKMADRLGRIEARGLRARALVIADSLAAAPRRWESALGDRVLGRAGALAEAARAVGALYVPERLHAARISAKKLRYSLELGRDAAALPVAREIRALTRVQDLLGHLHDLQILRAEVQMAATGRARSRPVQAIVAACDAECRTLHAQFLSRLPTVVALCERVSARARLINRPMMRVSPEGAFASRHSRAGAARRA